MDFLKYAGAVLTDAVDAISIANRRLALTNRLRPLTGLRPPRPRLCMRTWAAM